MPATRSSSSASPTRPAHGKWNAASAAPRAAPPSAAVRSRSSRSTASSGAAIPLRPSPPRHCSRRPRVEAELARGLLLQCRGGEGRSGIAAPLLAVDRDDLERTAALGGAARGAADAAFHFPCAGLVGEAELLDLVAGIFYELQRKGLFRVLALAIQRPIFLGFEGIDLRLALTDHAQCRALHATRRQAASDFLPQQRREVEADQVIECAARLLGVDQRRGDLAGRGNRGADRILGDLVEGDAMYR